eukprot:2206502-Amphidinium_carterae.1
MYVIICVGTVNIESTLVRRVSLSYVKSVFVLREGYGHLLRAESNMCGLFLWQWLEPKSALRDSAL